MNRRGGPCDLGVKGEQQRRRSVCYVLFPSSNACARCIEADKATRMMPTALSQDREGGREKNPLPVLLRNYWSLKVPARQPSCTNGFPN